MPEDNNINVSQENNNQGNNKKKLIGIISIVSALIIASVLAVTIALNTNKKLNINISNISVQNYPEIQIHIDKTAKKSCFSKENINFYENGSSIKDFEIIKEDDGWTLSYICDEKSRNSCSKDIKIENNIDTEDFVTSVYEKPEQKQVDISINQVDTNNYPEVNVYFTVYDGKVSIEDIVNGNTTLSEKINGELVKQDIKDFKFVDQNEPVSINMVMDTSGSMDTSINMYKNVANNFLNNIDFNSGDKVGLVQFNDTSNVVNYFSNNKESLSNSINGLRTSGMTALYDSLIMSLEQTNRQGGAKCIIAYTDGLDNSSKNSDTQVIDLSRKLGIPIYIISLGNETRENNTLRNICNQTAGEFINVNNVNEMEGIYNNILKKTKKQFVLTYNTDESLSDTVKRNINIDINSFDYKGNKDGEYEIKPKELRVDLQKYNELINNIKIDVNDNFKAINGNYSFAFKDLNQNDFVSINSEKSIAASVIKVYIMIEAYDQIKHNKLNLNDVLVLRDEDKAEGSGTLQNEAAGKSLTIEELIKLMMLKSDNTAANMLIDRIGMNNINNRIKALGCVNTELNRKMMDSNAINSGIENYTSVDDLCLTFTKLYNGQCIDSNYDKMMVDLMKNNENDKKIPAQLDKVTQVSHKTGEYNGVQNDAGIVFDGNNAYVVCFMTKNGDEQPQIDTIAKTSKDVFDVFDNYKK